MDTTALLQGSSLNGRSSVEPWELLPALLLEGNTQVSGSFVAVQMMCFTVFAMDFVRFATLLWVTAPSHGPGVV